MSFWISEDARRMFGVLVGSVIASLRLLGAKVCVFVVVVVSGLVADLSSGAGGRC